MKSLQLAGTHSHKTYKSLNKLPVLFTYTATDLTIYLESSWAQILIAKILLNAFVIFPASMLELIIVWENKSFPIHHTINYKAHSASKTLKGKTKDFRANNCLQTQWMKIETSLLTNQGENLSTEHSASQYQYSQMGWESWRLPSKLPTIFPSTRKDDYLLFSTTSIDTITATFRWGLQQEQ